MTTTEFALLLRRFTDAVAAGDGARFAQCFTEDAVYHDYIYGAHRGRDDIARMLEERFWRDARDYRWEMLDPVSDGARGYASWLFSYTSLMPGHEGRRILVEGMSRFRLSGGLIADYAEAVNGGVAMVQLGLAPERIEKRLRRWADDLLARPDAAAHLRHEPPS